MFNPSFGPRQGVPRQQHPVSAFLLVLLVLQAACATGRPLSGTGVGMHASPLGPPLSRAAREGSPLRFNAPVDFSPLEVSEEEIAQALATLLLHTPLPIAQGLHAPPLRHSVLFASANLPGSSWQARLTYDYGAFCQHRTTPGDCLGVFDNGTDWEDKDKVRLALSLAVNPAREGLDGELRRMLSTGHLWNAVAVAIASYTALLFLPEPASKVVAAGFGVLVWLYLGWEVVALGRAYFRLQEEAARATTWEELRMAGKRFGSVMGPKSLHVLLMVGTLTAGSTTALMSRVSRLPGYTALVSRAQARGLHLETALETGTRAHVDVVAGTFSTVVPANALAMAGVPGRVSAQPEEPTQHHIATVENSSSSREGGPWTPEFKKLFDDVGLSMENVANKVLLRGHKGPHPRAYHEEVHHRLRKVLKGCGGKTQTVECQEKFVNELRKMADELQNPGSKLHKLLYRIPLTE